MGMFEEMKKHEEQSKGGTIHAEFKHDGEGIATQCSVNATGGEVRALMISLANEVCEVEKTSPIEFFAELAVMSQAVGRKK